jgi:hypothetical protein
MLDFCEEGEGWSAEWLEGLRALLAAGDQEAAIAHCLPHASALFWPGEVEGLIDGEEEIEAESVNLSGLWLESEDGEDAPLFRWWSARFALPIPAELLEAWSEETPGGGRQWSEERYEAWLEDNDIWGLQEAVRFSLWGVLYELDGMGEMACYPDEEAVNDVLQGG